MARPRPTQPSPPAAPPARGPEKKIVFSGGIGVAVWLNAVQGDNGPRKVRSITISPRRYRDRDTGEWRDAKGFYPGDIPALLLALQRAQEFIITTPIPGEPRDDTPDNGDDIPY